MEDGQGDTTPTVTNDGQIKELQDKLDASLVQLKEHESTINRLRGTQSSNDRTIADYKSKIESATAKITDYESQINAVNTEFGSAKSTIEELTAKVSGFDELSVQIAKLKEDNTRVLIAASKAAQSPIVSALINNNALPVADTLEEFEKALDNIISGVSGEARIQAQGILAGSKPNPKNIGGAESPDQLRREAQALILQKKIPEGLEMIRRAEELELKTSS